MTSEQLQMISADPRVMHGPVVMDRTRAPVSVILDCLAAEMNADEIIAEFTAMTLAGIPAGASGTAEAREEPVRIRTADEHHPGKTENRE